MSRTLSVPDPDRRALVAGLSSLAALAVAACTSATHAEPHAPDHEHHEDEDEEHEAEVTPGEDLMQEHGVLERVLLTYEEFTVRVEAKTAFDPALVVSAATIVRKFVEEYHEKNEENFVFPRLEKAKKELELVATLKKQHEKGRLLTDAILATARAGGALDGAKLTGLIRSFIRMYRPHASREETVLFPAFRSTMDKDGYRELGEKFEENEHKIFGKDGFDDAVAQVAKIETALEIHDLAKFTPA